MATLTTVLGSNSALISYGKTDPTELMDSIKVVVASLSNWTFLTTSGSYSYFSCPQQSGPVDSYLKGVRIELSATALNVAAYEKADIVADDTTINLRTYGTALTMDLDAPGELYVLISNQHVVLLGADEYGGTNANDNRFVGAIEISRDTGVEVGADQPYQWMSLNSAYWISQSQQLTSFVDNTGTTYSGQTHVCRMTTDFVSWGRTTSSSNMTLSTSTLMPNADLVSGHTLASSIRYQWHNTPARANTRMIGRAYNLNLIADNASNTINQYTTIDVAVDQYGFADTVNGSVKPHMVIDARYGCLILPL